MMTPKQRASLRALANALDPVMQIGKEGINDTIVENLDLLLNSRELAKIKVLKNCELSAREVANIFAERVSWEIVQVIGGNIVLYKRSTKKNFKHIEL